MTGDLSQAKRLFVEHSGSHYEMERSGVYSEYLKFRVPPSEEHRWAAERCLELTESLRRHPVADDSFRELMALIQAVHDFDSLRAMLDIIEQQQPALDSFTQLRFAEDLYGLRVGLVSKSQEDNDLIRRSNDLIRQLLRLASSPPLTIDPYYNQLPHLVGLLTEEKIQARTRRLAARLGAGGAGGSNLPP